VRNLTGSSVLQQDWNNIKQNYLKPELVSAWYWASQSQALAHTESDFDPDSVSILREDLEKLEASARVPGLPYDLRMFIDRQVRLIRSALRRYEVCGVGAIRDAARAAVGEALAEHSVIVEADRSADPATRDAVGGLRKLWKDITEVAGDADKIRKGVEAAAALVKVLPFLGD